MPSVFTWQGLIAAWGGVTSLAWIGANLKGLGAGLRFRKFGSLAAAEPSAWPRLSVVVPACDEAEHLEAALASLLAQDYPDLEVLLVDDRSTDGTGDVVDAIAARDPRARAIHVEDLPDGWLGKVNALERGTREATGAWTLYTDADVHFRPGVLRRAVAWCEAEGVDHLAVAPELRPGGFWQEVAESAFGTGFMLGTNATRVREPGSRDYVGVGAFNLVRRRVFDRTPGFAWLRMEVLDDVGLGRMMREAGARPAFAMGLEDLWIAWYPSLGAMARGLEKNFFGVAARYSVSRLAGFLLMLAVMLPGPLVALTQPWSAGVRGLGALVAALVVVNAAVLRARTGRRLATLILAPAGFVILAAFLLRSAWHCQRRGGVVWRGTFYPLDALRRGMRVRL